MLNTINPAMASFTKLYPETQHHAAAGNGYASSGYKLGEECDGHKQRIPASRTRG